MPRRPRSLGSHLLLAITLTVGSIGSGDILSAQTCPPLDPIDDGTGLSIGLLISEISPGVHIELHNPTAVDVDLASINAQLCSRPDYAAVLLLVGTETIVAAGGYMTLPWPAAFTDTDAGGEIVLYSGIDFAAPSQVMDFVCWGVNPHFSRKAVAENAGKWSGGCLPPLTAGALTRLPMTDGTTIASYDPDSAPTPLDCGTPSSPILFSRGDCNLDAAFNIADSIALLSFLFPMPGAPTTPLGCEDSCDANDDGQLDIADAVTKLTTLFPPGTPAPLPAPYPGCGSDPTVDTLVCGPTPCP